MSDANVYRDLKGNEIRKGDTLLYFTGRSSSIHQNEGEVQGFKDGKVLVMVPGNTKVSRLSNYGYTGLVINDPFRALHEKMPGLAKLWKKYATFKIMST